MVATSELGQREEERLLSNLAVLCLVIGGYDIVTNSVVTSAWLVWSAWHQHHWSGQCDISITGPVGVEMVMNTFKWGSNAAFGRYNELTLLEVHVHILCSWFQEMTWDTSTWGTLPYSSCDLTHILLLSSLLALFSSFASLQITEEYSCDRISEAAGTLGESANGNLQSINGNLDVVYKVNNKSPMKWQYFGSEYGIINQFPTSKASDCSSYDHRFRSDSHTHL